MLNIHARARNKMKYSVSVAIENQWDAAPMFANICSNLFFSVIECMSFQTFTTKAHEKKMTWATCRLGCT